ncbi:LytR/AlgR family response regulator transcription factor [Desulfocurvus sp. DL9XJH121]
MPLRTLIVDDEPPARDELAYLLSAFEDVDAPAQAGSAREAVEMIRELEPDLVFLDIEMPGGNGFDVVSACMDMEIQPLFVFATAFEHYAIQAFEENAVDYLLKPVTEERLTKSLARAREALATRQSRDRARMNMQNLLSGPSAPGITRIPVERGGRIALLRPTEVIFCSTEERKVMVHTRDEAWPCHGVNTLDGLEERMVPHAFFRAGRGALVNLARIREFSPWFNGKYILVMDDEQGTEITVSRGRVPMFKDQLGL